jgi:hypothetical protein
MSAAWTSLNVALMPSNPIAPWVDRVPYDESCYLSALQKRHSPILKFAAQSTS